MTKELAIYEEMAMITIKPFDNNTAPQYRFIKWAHREAFDNEVNTKRMVKIGDESFPSRNIEKVEKVKGRVPTKEVLHIVEQKIAKYKSTFFRNPSEKELNVMTENAYKEVEKK